LENAEFIRYGQMHRNTYIASPMLLQPTMQFRTRENVFFAGQITGVEGYLGSIATGLVAGINAVSYLKNHPLTIFPATTMIGALTHYVTHAEVNHFQPMKANYGIITPYENPPRNKTEKYRRIFIRSMQSLNEIPLPQ